MINNTSNLLLYYYPTYGHLTDLYIAHEYPVDPLVSTSFDRGGATVNDGFREAAPYVAEVPGVAESSPREVVDFIHWDIGVGELTFAEGHYFFNKGLVIYSRL